MSAWPKHPIIYEINTRIWIEELGLKYGQPFTLSSVPPEEWDALGSLHIDAVWLMGVWERSPMGLRLSLKNRALATNFHKALPDFRPHDLVGSPYSIRRYVADKSLGGPEGLKTAREELRKRGIKLVLDFVPNHTAPDHPWVSEHPEYYIRGSLHDFENDPETFIDCQGNILALGRDPFFPPWPDVVQLNAFQPAFREAALHTLQDIAGQCDGVRCDMAMLFIGSIFERNWGERVGEKPESEFWQETIRAVKQGSDGFLFIAEAYWDLEWELQQQGFDYCYDKRLYDRLEQGSAESVDEHLRANLGYQSKLVRFIENHDEPRARSFLGALKERTAAVCIATLPGARLFHEGQFEGRKVRTSIFLRRRIEEPVDQDFYSLYTSLLKIASDETLKEGEWKLCDRFGWPDNSSFNNIVTWTWTLRDKKYLVALNLSDTTSQARIRLPWRDLKGKVWKMTDLSTGKPFEHSGDELSSLGFYVDLGPWNYHIFADWNPEETPSTPSPQAKALN